MVYLKDSFWGKELYLRHCCRIGAILLHFSVNAIKATSLMKWKRHLSIRVILFRKREEKKSNQHILRRSFSAKRCLWHASAYITTIFGQLSIYALSFPTSFKEDQDHTKSLFSVHHCTFSIIPLFNVNMQLLTGKWS